MIGNLNCIEECVNLGTYLPMCLSRLINGQSMQVVGRLSGAALPNGHPYSTPELTVLGAQMYES